MTLAHNSKVKSLLNSDIVAKLFELKQKHSLGWRDISPLVGVSESTLSRIAGEKKAGGRQLLAGLELLLLVIKLNGKLKDYRAFTESMQRVMGTKAMAIHEDDPNLKKLSPGEQLIEEEADEVLALLERSRRQKVSYAKRPAPSVAPRRTKRRTASGNPNPPSS